MDNFLQAHLGIIRLLDYAQTLGVLGDVEDEGGYWEKRSLKALVREVDIWNNSIAVGHGVRKIGQQQTRDGNPRECKRTFASMHGPRQSP